jgi:hypothetical protein
VEPNGEHEPTNGNNDVDGKRRRKIISDVEPDDDEPANRISSNKRGKRLRDMSEQNCDVESCYENLERVVKMERLSEVISELEINQNSAVCIRHLYRKAASWSQMIHVLLTSKLYDCSTIYPHRHHRLKVFGR